MLILWTYETFKKKTLGTESELVFPCKGATMKRRQGRPLPENTNCFGNVHRDSTCEVVHLKTARALFLVLQLRPARACFPRAACKHLRHVHFRLHVVCEAFLADKFVLCEVKLFRTLLHALLRSEIRFSVDFPLRRSKAVLGATRSCMPRCPRASKELFVFACVEMSHGGF